MKIQELREKNDQELQKILAEKRELLRATRFNVAQNQHKNYKELRVMKKEIAQILTVMKERELVAELAKQ